MVEIVSHSSVSFEGCKKYTFIREKEKKDTNPQTYYY
jgi:hypothetical protein